MAKDIKNLNILSLSAFICLKKLKKSKRFFAPDGLFLIPLLSI
jgi:hypothetical protein